MSTKWLSLVIVVVVIVVVQKIYSRMHTDTSNIYQDVTKFVNWGMVKNTKT